jgi:hypothetical protein
VVEGSIIYAYTLQSIIGVLIFFVFLCVFIVFCNHRYANTLQSMIIHILRTMRVF